MVAIRVAGRLVAGLAVLTLAAGCGAAATASPSATAAPPPPASPAAVASQAATPTPASTPTPTLWTDGKAAAVVGSMDCNTVVKAGAESSPGVTPITLTHQIFMCTVTTNDPRVNGSGNLDLTIEGWDPTLGFNAVSWAYQEIKGPAGSWAGRSYGVYDKDGIARFSGVAAGSGAYKGLVFVTSGTLPFNTANVDIIGVIQPGTPPPGFPVTPLTTP